MIKVYHVAHPDVVGYIQSCSPYPNYVNVEFEKPVAFNDYPPKEHWGCNLGLLYTTPTEAKKNSHTYKEKNKPTGRKLILVD